MISMLQKLRDPFAEIGPGADFLYAIDRVKSSLSTRAAACLRTHRAADSRQAAAAATIGCTPSSRDRGGRWRDGRDARVGNVAAVHACSWSSAVRARLSLRAGDHDARRHANALPHTDVAAGP
jgi:hypothetical protein